ncbi:MAG: thiamine phosphate synthase [Hyphomicrobiales bacterium]|nr:thiamine phosphate synthase [Hyphomicrobiales bacterium]
MKRLDLRLYALVDPAQSGGHEPVALARAAAAGGAGLVQLRDKTGTTRAMVARAKAVVAALEGSGVPVLINDRVDVALAAGAAGVHLGQEDMPPDIARRLLGKRAIIGITVRSEEEAENAAVDVADYVGVGGVFSTVSKDNLTAPIGLAGLGRLAGLLRARRADILLVAIAGIDAGNAADIIAAGADGVAVISALAKARDPEAAARELRAIVDAALKERNAS